MASSKKAGIKPGIYVSWPHNGYFGVNKGKVNFGKGGDPDKQAAYTKAYEKLITEAYGNYGPFCEIWFDGGVLPVEKGGPDVAPILEKFQPKAVVFLGPTSSIRWVGNENSTAPDPCWATASRQGEYHGGTPTGTMWMPAECDVPLRSTWFWQPNAEKSIRSLNKLMDIYRSSVGHNANLTLNANRNPVGNCRHVHWLAWHSPSARNPVAGWRLAIPPRCEERGSASRQRHHQTSRHDGRCRAWSQEHQTAHACRPFPALRLRRPGVAPARHRDSGHLGRIARDVVPGALPLGHNRVAR